LINFREWFEKNKNISLENFFRNKFDRNVSEFNMLGAYIYYIEQKNNYIFIDTNSHGFSSYNPCKQFWSWGGITPEIENYLISKTTI
jgi:hypothetical protein